MITRLALPEGYCVSAATEHFLAGLPQTGFAKPLTILKEVREIPLEPMAQAESLTFHQRVDGAIAEYLDSSYKTRKEVAQNWGISDASITRHLRHRGLSLTPQQVYERQVNAGKKNQSPHWFSRACAEGCTCKRHSRQNPDIILGRKTCSKCKRFRHLVDFDARSRNEDGEAVTWQSQCKTCARIRCRVSSGIRRRGKPFKPRKFGAKKGEVLRRHRREMHARKMKEDPAYAADRREYARIYAEAKRREQGIPVRPKKNNGKKEHGERLPAGPMTLWVRKNINRYEGEASNMAKYCGVDEGTIRRLNDGIVGFISEDVADRILTREGSTDLWEVYPHLYERY